MSFISFLMACLEHFMSPFLIPCNMTWLFFVVGFVVLVFLFVFLSALPTLENTWLWEEVVQIAQWSKKLLYEAFLL